MQRSCRSQGPQSFRDHRILMIGLPYGFNVGFQFRLVLPARQTAHWLAKSILKLLPGPLLAGFLSSSRLSGLLYLAPLLRQNLELLGFERLAPA